MSRRRVAMRLGAALAGVVVALTSCATSHLQRQVAHFVKGKPARIGVAMDYQGKTVCQVRAKKRFPMMSVFKLHQAVAVLDSLNDDTAMLSEKVWITKDMLRKDTYSPLRDKYPEGNVSLTLAELLHYTLWLSDNNACDILFDKFGGTAYVSDRMKAFKLRHTRIKWTEADMHADIHRCTDNYTSPRDAISILKRAYDNPWLRTCLSECKTGQSRMPGLLPPQTTVGHKTGTGDRTPDALCRGVNDIGFVMLPDGNPLFIAVFCDESELSMGETEAIIAEIARMAYIDFVRRSQSSTRPCSPP